MTSCPMDQAPFFAWFGTRTFLIVSFQAVQSGPEGPSTWNSASDVRYQPRKSRSFHEGVRDGRKVAAASRLSLLLFWRKIRETMGPAISARVGFCPRMPVLSVDSVKNCRTPVTAFAGQEI